MARRRWISKKSVKRARIQIDLSLFCLLFLKTRRALNRRSESRSRSHSLCLAHEGRIVVCFCDVWVNNVCIEEKEREKKGRKQQRYSAAAVL